jgi:nucleoside phosphorylase
MCRVANLDGVSRRLVAVIALLGSLLGVGSARAAPATTCTQRTLILSAMPVELQPLLAHTTARHTVTKNGHDYFLGRLSGRDVVLTLTGIGPVNARRSTQAALGAFRCGRRSGINGVVFSGVAGGDYIGDVAVPTRWTADAGRHFLGVDARMLAAARRTATAHVALERKAPAGDPACGCVTSPDAVTTVDVTHPPRIEVGGKGQTTDPFAGRALACVPGGGDVLGCDPCITTSHPPAAAQRFAPSVLPFLDPSFFSGYASSSAEGTGYAAEDEETAAVDAVATAQHVPFIGFRAVSDGGGDPLGLPGFPVQFFYYRQLAATATRAFLAIWRPIAG